MHKNVIFCALHVRR